MNLPNGALRMRLPTRDKALSLGSMLIGMEQGEVKSYGAWISKRLRSPQGAIKRRVSLDSEKYREGGRNPGSRS